MIGFKKGKLHCDILEGSSLEGGSRAAPDLRLTESLDPSPQSTSGTELEKCFRADSETLRQVQQGKGMLLFTIIL